MQKKIFFTGLSCFTLIVLICSVNAAECTDSWCSIGGTCTESTCLENGKSVSGGCWFQEFPIGGSCASCTVTSVSSCAGYGGNKLACMNNHCKVNELKGGCTSGSSACEDFCNHITECASYKIGFGEAVYKVNCDNNLCKDKIGDCKWDAATLTCIKPPTNCFDCCAALGATIGCNEGNCKTDCGTKVGGKGCFYVKNACQNCDIVTNCDDYEDDPSCTSNACGISQECEWKNGACAEKGTTGSCSDSPCPKAVISIGCTEADCINLGKNVDGGCRWQDRGVDLLHDACSPCKGAVTSCTDYTADQEMACKNNHCKVNMPYGCIWDGTSCANKLKIGTCSDSPCPKGVISIGCTEADCINLGKYVDGGCRWQDRGVDLLHDACSPCKGAVTSCSDYTADQEMACKNNHCKVNMPNGCIWEGASCANAAGAKTCEEACKPNAFECSTEDLVTKYAATKDVTKKTGPTCSTGDCYCLKNKGTETGSGSNDVISRIKTAVYRIVITIYCLVLYITSTVAALFIILTGIKYMSSDEANNRAESRRRMVYALVGLMVIALACPLVNVLFVNTQIGIPNASTGVIEACPGCPYINQMTSTMGGLGGLGGGGGGGYVGGGSGDTGGSWLTPARQKQAESFQDCTTTPCPAGKVCASATGVYRCYPKVADGYSYDASSLTPQSGDKADLCFDGFISGDKCIHNPICANAAGCAGSEYCGSDKSCKPKVGEGEDCSASMLFGDTNANLICKTGHGCISTGKCTKKACDIKADCQRLANTYCDEDNRECMPKLAKGKLCRDSLIRDGNTNGNANDMCASGTCSTATSPAKCT
jgi:hypothetical protein